MMHVFILVEPTKFSNTCKPAFTVFGCFITAEFIVAEFILYMRAYAVWGRTRPMLVLIVLLYFIFCIPTLYFTGRFIGSATVLSLPFLPSGCLFNLRGDIERLAMAMIMVLETFALIVLLVKTYQMPDSRTMKVLFVDGVIYFTAILCATIVNVIILSVASPSIWFMIFTQCALHSICCNRLLLRIRGVYSSPSTPTSVFSQTPSSADASAYDIELMSPSRPLPTRAKLSAISRPFTATHN
ncbi:hypothetical protein DFH11DRAFT_1622860 [Phellopilus nigrolimitatus]|nr:hypothetical protein DFH11DRAFT_1622860 [Phellopilus nigrolimitatus]